MKRSLAVAVLACAVAIAVAIASTSHHATTRGTISQPLPAPVTACPVGNSFMGCAVSTEGIPPRAVAPPAGSKFVDVSEFQPNVNWRAVKAAGVIGVVIKAGEAFSEDRTFILHLDGARAAGLKVAVYWFERPVGCTAEAAAIDRVVPRGLKVIFDEEVPGLSGYGRCERAAVQSHTGVEPGEYTSPGVLSDRSLLPLWEATFGPALSVLWRPLIAWQYTDVASVPGIGGLVDESVNYGLFPTTKPLLPVCFSHRITKTDCAAAKAKIASDERAAASSRRALAAVDRVLTVNGCRKPYRRAICRRDGASAAVFAQRVRYFTAAAAKVKAAS